MRALRLARGVSQVQLGEAIGVSFQQIQKYERGANRIATSTLFALAAALDASMASLIPAPDAGALPEATSLEDPQFIALSVEFAKLSQPKRRMLLDIARTLRRRGDL